MRIGNLCFREENNGEGNDFFSFDWEKEYSSERKLKLKNGHEAHFIVSSAIQLIIQ